MTKNTIYKTDTLFILFICLFIFIIRAPFFFVDWLDSDEATFILKGLAITQGKIPYVDFHNWKPPISGYFLTIPIYIAENSLLAIRFFTALIVSTSCIFLYKIGLLFNFSKHNSFLTSLIFGISVSFITRSFRSQSFYSEHISILLILISIYLILKCLEKKNNFYFILQGCLLGIATLNTPYLGFFAILYTAFPLFLFKDKIKTKLTYSLNIILGGFIILFIFLIYFYPKFPNILSYIIMVPLEFFKEGGAHDYTIYSTIYHLVGGGLQVDSIKFFSAIFIWGFGFFGFLHILYAKKDEKKYLALITVFVILSINLVLIGYPSGRYLIIIAPFYCILLIYFINLKLFSNFKLMKNLILILIFIFPLTDWYKNILILKDVSLNKKTYTHGRCTDLYNSLEKKKLLNKKIYFQGCAINKFFINQLPLFDIYQPDNIDLKDSLKAFNKKNLGDELFTKDPEILVLSKDLNEFVGGLKFNKINPKNVLIEYEYLYRVKVDKDSIFYIYKK